MEEEYDSDIGKYVPEEATRKIFAKVFDRQTIEAIHKLSTMGYFDIVEYVISTGKEAHVFRAVDSAGNYRAVKIYKIETSDFNNMFQYIDKDRRFKNVKKNKRDIVFAWAKKEFKNLTLFSEAGVRVPMPIAQMRNVLVMEFIGKEGKAAPTLKKKALENNDELYDFIVKSIAKSMGNAELVHADLSQFNILNNGGELVIIDCGQSVLTSHPKAKEFFERDLKNLASYFSKIGLKKGFSELYNDIKAEKEKIPKK